MYDCFHINCWFCSWSTVDSNGGEGKSGGLSSGGGKVDSSGNGKKIGKTVCLLK